MADAMEDDAAGDEQEYPVRSIRLGARSAIRASEFGRGRF